MAAVNAILDEEFAKTEHQPLLEDPVLVFSNHGAALNYFEAKLEADFEAAVAVAEAETEAEAEVEQDGVNHEENGEEEVEEVERGETRVEQENAPVPTGRPIAPLKKGQPGPGQVRGGPTSSNARAQESFNPFALRKPSQGNAFPPQPYSPFTPQSPPQPDPFTPHRKSPSAPQSPSRSVSSTSIRQGASTSTPITTSKTTTKTQKPPLPAQPGRHISVGRSRVQPPKARMDGEKPVEASAEVVYIAVSKVRDGSADVLPEEVFAVLRRQVEKWDSGKQGPAWCERVPGFFTTIKCVDRHIASKTSEWERKDGRLYHYWACKLCSSKGRVCALLETPGTLTILPKAEMDREPTSGPADNDFWV